MARNREARNLVAREVMNPEVKEARSPAARAVRNRVDKSLAARTFRRNRRGLRQSSFRRCRRARPAR